VLLCCSQVLQKFEIGDLDTNEVLDRYEKQGSNDAFYKELKETVLEYFHENKVSHPRSIVYVILPANFTVCVKAVRCGNNK
jgi:hypothetical protein